MRASRPSSCRRLRLAAVGIPERPPICHCAPAAFSLVCLPGSGILCSANQLFSLGGSAQCFRLDSFPVGLVFSRSGGDAGPAAGNSCAARHAPAGRGASRPQRAAALARPVARRSAAPALGFPLLAGSRCGCKSAGRMDARCRRPARRLLHCTERELEDHPALYATATASNPYCCARNRCATSARPRRLRLPDLSRRTEYLPHRDAAQRRAAGADSRAASDFPAAHGPHPRPLDS